MADWATVLVFYGVVLLAFCVGGALCESWLFRDDEEEDEA